MMILPFLEALHALLLVKVNARGDTEWKQPSFARESSGATAG
jgi:hypothetical protein